MPSESEPSISPADTLRTKIIIPMIDKFGPRVMLVAPSKKFRKQDYNKGTLVNNSTHETLAVEYDAFTRDMAVSYSKRDVVGSLVEEREFRGDWAFGYFTLKITAHDRSRKSCALHRVGLQFGPINRTRINGDTSRELQVTESILDRLLPKK